MLFIPKKLIMQNDIVRLDNVVSSYSGLSVYCHSILTVNYMLVLQTWDMLLGASATRGFVICH